jgi:hypothetical protein
MVNLEVDSASNADAFRTALRDMWRQVDGQKIMESPRVQIVDAVESKEY